jgi:hypothetical protein
LSSRRGFLRKGLSVLLGSALGAIALPALSTAPTVEVSAIGDRQLRLLLASKALLEKAGMLRASSIFHYAPDTGEIQMDWTVSIPPEDSISPEIDALAQNVLTLVNG